MVNKLSRSAGFVKWRKDGILFFGFVILVGWAFWFQDLNPAIIPILLLLILRSLSLIVNHETQNL